MKKKIVGIIPSRYDSTRLPGKALVDIGGKTMIQRVYEQALKAKYLDKVVVATDSERIYEHIQSIGGNVLMTATTHRNGTERCAEVAQKLGHEFQVAINIQGDEPFIDPQQIDLIGELFEDDETEIATLIKKIEVAEQIFDEKEAKVVFNRNMEAIYFSRSAIPFLNGVPMKNWFKKQDYYKHLGIYGFQTSILSEIAELPPSALELSEGLEQLRWLDYYSIRVAVSATDTLAIDTPEDLKKVEAYLKKIN
ncbi:MAG: 3-deoxy-manno-octulosonate cytidylyltransferase [Cytophagales bacterium]|nr:MAG: 3-deoxy-manno-octulosonate cytidylyltransferase [Cytophagales bacterium]